MPAVVFRLVLTRLCAQCGVGTLRPVRGVTGLAVDMSFLIADQDYYEPWDTIDPGPRYDAGLMPAGWTRLDSGAWTHWGPAGLLLPDQGWKIHVSSSLSNAQSVLAVVSTACAELGVPFK